jgi:hypothetical protein
MIPRDERQRTAIVNIADCAKRLRVVIARHSMGLRNRRFETHFRAATGVDLSPRSFDRIYKIYDPEKPVQKPFIGPL